MKKYFFLIILFSCSSYLFAQEEELVFEKFSVQSGLSSQTVRGIFQDREGYLWFGSINGVSRFDGFVFKTYKHEPNSKTSITTGFVNVIYEDSKGNLWIGTSTGLNKLNRKTGEARQYAPADPSIMMFKFDIQSIFEDSRGVLWFGTHMGLNTVDSSHEKLNPFIPEKFKEVFPNIAFKSVIEDNQGILWFGTGIGLFKYDRNTGEITPVWIDPDPPALMSKNWNTGDYAVQSIYKDESGILWSGSFGGTLIKINPLTSQMEHYLLQDSLTSEKFPLQSIHSEDNSKLWIATLSGLLLFDKTRCITLVRYVYDEDFKEGLSDSRLTNVFKDRSGSLWVGTMTGGLNKLNRTRFPFNKYLRRIWGVDKSNTLVPFKDMIVSRTGSVFIAATNGIEEIKPDRKEIINHPPFKVINVLYEDRAGNLWIAIKQYSGGGFYKKDVSGNLYPILDSAGAMFVREIQCLYETRKGKVYFASEFYLFEVDIEKNTASLVFKTNRRIFSLCDYNDMLCIGTLAGGMYFFNPERRTVIKHFVPEENNPASIGDITTLDLFVDSKNILWIGTTLGINRYIPETGGFKVFDEKKGLAHGSVVKIIEDNNNNLWLGTGNGISMFNPETETFKNYDVSYGLLEGFYNAGGKSKTGEIYLKARTGITYFNPDNIKDNPFIPPVVITEMKVLNNPYPLTDNIKLSYSENYISLEFAALSYISPEKNKYAYMMEGVDKDWVYSGNRRYASYTSLEPGEYTFRVKASNNDGVWNEAGTSLSIIIAPPWYRTYWAYGIYILFLASIAYGWRRYDLKRQNLKYQVKLEHENAQKQEEISKMKSRFFTNISHEFRTPLTLIIGPAEKIISAYQDSNLQKLAGMMKRNALHLLGLVNQLLDISKLDEGKLKLQISRGNLFSFIRGVAMIFESHAESKDIILKVKPDKEDIEGYFDKEKMEKVLINIISNALKFTPEGGKIIVSVSATENNKAVIKIKDTGIGISPSELPKLFDRFYQVDSSHTREQGGTGIGLALTKELVELHRGKVSVESVEGEWTEFTVEIPIGRENYKYDEIVETVEEQFTDERYINLAEQIDAGLQESLTSSSISVSMKHGEDTDGEKQIILVVEDNEDVRQYIRDSLESDYVIEEAVNGEHGYRKAEVIIPDLIIGDIMMPKMDGYEMTKKIREDEKTFHIPIILLTAKSDHKSKLEGYEKGADAYIVKPFDTNELRIRITNLINIRQKLQEKFARGERIPVRGEEKKLSDLNVKFINKVIDVMDKHIAEEEFSIEEFGKELYMSRAQLHRKLKALTGKSASRYLRSFRLNAARKMIEEKKGTISEIAYSVGFSSPIYFSKCFRDEYGYPPSEISNSK